MRLPLLALVAWLHTWNPAGALAQPPPAPTPATATPPPLSPATLRAALASKPTGAAADELAAKLRAWFSADGLRFGDASKNIETDVAWAVEAPNATEVRLVSNFRRWTRPLIPVGNTGLWAVALNMPDGTALQWAYEIDGHRTGGGEVEVYSTHPDERERPGVPRGVVKTLPAWRSPRIYAGTERTLSIYVPAQYQPGTAAAAIVFTDGESYLPYAPTVLDNLIAAGDMPVTVGIFVSPGNFATGAKGKAGSNRSSRSNRSAEYDTLSDVHARFILDEIFPAVQKLAALKIDPRPTRRAVVGASSGGICAFTAAWQRPEAFGKVLSLIGSFVDIAAGASLREGGHNYPALIRKTPPKPIRIFMQDGENDLNNEHGDWYLANREMESALRWSGYDVRAIYGHGFHSHRHGRALLPDALRWLWRDHASEAGTPAPR